MNQKQFEAAVVIGRFQIPHEGHIKLFEKANEIANKLVIIVGSVGQPRTPKNPFSFEERKTMLESVIPEGTNYEILPVQDQKYNLQNWIVDIVNTVNSTLPPGWTDYPRKVALVGRKKDASTFYLNLFPQWTYFEQEEVKLINATDIREAIYRGYSKYRRIVQQNVTPSIGKILDKWIETPSFAKLQTEFKFMEEYKKGWDNSPYPPMFITVDAIVIQSGHLLLVKRRSEPGKGLYALPGGFLKPNETLEEAAIRELKEETLLKLPELTLKRTITERRVYDDPDRSSRGRTVTHAFLFELQGHDLPKVKGADDAEKAVWKPLNEVYMMGEQLFEDHLDIILNITGNK